MYYNNKDGFRWWKVMTSSLVTKLEEVVENPLFPMSFPTNNLKQHSTSYKDKIVMYVFTKTECLFSARVLYNDYFQGQFDKGP